MNPKTDVDLTVICPAGSTASEIFRDYLPVLQQYFGGRVHTGLVNISTFEFSDYLSSEFLEKLDNGVYSLEVTLQNDFKIVFLKARRKSILSITFSRDYALTCVDQVRTLFRALVNVPSTIFGQCHVDAHARQMLLTGPYWELHRVGKLNGLFWLNFLGPEEEHLQGGPTIEDNPIAKVKRLPSGLILEVGESPFDALTPEGEQLLVDATLALPPPNPKPPIEGIVDVDYDPDANWDEDEDE
jgi:hypothetical protein